MDRSAAIILADAQAPEFEGPIQLQPHRDSTLIGSVLADVSTWPVDEVFVVLGDHAEAILEAVDFGGTTVIINSEWQEGVAASIRAALDFIVRMGGFDVVVLHDGATPGVTGDIVERLLSTFRNGVAPAVSPKYRYTRGDPTVVGAELWPRLLGMEDDEDPDKLLAAHPELIDEVWFDRLPPRRVVRPSDLSPSR